MQGNPVAKKSHLVAKNLGSMSFFFYAMEQYEDGAIGRMRMGWKVE